MALSQALKTLFFVETTAQAEHVRQLLQREKDGVIVVSSEKLSRYCSAAGIKNRWLGDYTDGARIVEIEQTAWKLADSWHSRERVAAFLNYRGVDLGDSIRLYMGLYLIWVLKNWARVESCLAKEVPGKVLVFEENQSSVPNSFFPGEEELICGKICSFLGVQPVVAQFQAPQRGSRPPAASEMIKSAMRVIPQAVYRALRVFQNGPAGEKSVLISSAPHHIESILPYLNKNKLFYLDESFRLAKAGVLLRANAQYFSYDADNSFARNRSAAGHEFSRGLLTVKNELCAAAEFYFEGRSFTPLMEGRLSYLVTTWAPKITDSVDFFYDFLKRRNVGAVLVDEDTVTFHKALVKVARLCGIATVQIPHSVNYENTQYDLLPVASEYLCVGGEGPKNFYREQQVDGENITVTGIPRYDHFNDKSDATGASGKEKIILFANTTLFDAMETRRTRREQAHAIRDLAECMKSISGAALWVRPHPLDNEFFWMRDVFKEAGYSNFKIIKQASYRELLDKCGLVVSFPSNAVIESLMIGKPTIVLNYFGQDVWNVPFFKQEGKALCASGFEELREKMRGALERDASFASNIKQARSWILERWILPPDGRAGERCAEFISGLLRRGECRQ